MNGPAKIMLIRHAEKPAEPPPYGVTEDGEQNQYSLSVRGWQRAGALIPFFSRPFHPAIAVPDAIYASATTDNAEVERKDAKSLRPMETVTPLARRLGCEFHTSIEVGDEPGLIEALRAESGTVLVAWEHNRIPSIAAGFVDNPPAWGDAFDAVWVLDRQPDGTYAFSAVAQDLLAGDGGA
jgi:broad specificity phosphatase PhoE